MEKKKRDLEIFKEIVHMVEMEIQSGLPILEAYKKVAASNKHTTHTLVVKLIYEKYGATHRLCQEPEEGEK